jgi:hypothetical protein
MKDSEIIKELYLLVEKGIDDLASVEHPRAEWLSGELYDKYENLLKKIQNDLQKKLDKSL